MLAAHQRDAQPAHRQSLLEMAFACLRLAEQEERNSKPTLIHRA
jgi:hypothetical protein